LLMNGWLPNQGLIFSGIFKKWEPQVTNIWNTITPFPEIC
jgi:hypothetical protein